MIVTPIKDKQTLSKPWFVLGKSQYIITSGTAFKAQLDYSGSIPSIGSNFTLFNSVINEVFTLEGTPNDSGNEVLFPDPFDINVLTENIVSTLRSNYRFHKHYTITDTFIIEARNKGVKYDLNLSGNLFEFNTDFNIVNGLDDVLKSNLKFWVEVEINGFKFEFLTSNYTRRNGFSFFRVDINNILENHGIAPDLFHNGDVSVNETDLKKTIHIRSAEALGIPTYINAIDDHDTFDFMPIDLPDIYKELISDYEFDAFIDNLENRLSINKWNKYVYRNNFESINYQLDFSVSENYNLEFAITNSNGDIEIYSKPFSIEGPGGMSFVFEWSFILNQLTDITMTDVLFVAVNVLTPDGTPVTGSYSFTIYNRNHQEIETLFVRNSFQLWEAIPILSIENSFESKHKNYKVHLDEDIDNAAILESSKTNFQRSILYQDQNTALWINALLSNSKNFLLKNDLFDFSPVKLKSIRLKDKADTFDDNIITFEPVVYEYS